MTSLLSRVTQSARAIGQRIVIAGQEKIGKTTLGCNAPRPLLIPMEMGHGAMQVHRTPMIESWSDLCGLLDELRASCISGRNQFRTFTFDSATALERLIHEATLQEDKQWRAGNPAGLTLESAHGGYGKAYALANDKFAMFTRYCDEFAINAGINIVVTCHVFAAKVVDPAAGEFDQWDLLLHSPKNQKTYGKREFITQWADMVGFLHEPVFVVKGDKGQVVTRAVSANQGRVLAVDRSPAWVAGNRYGLTGTIPIPPINGWNAVAHAIHAKCGLDIFNRDV